MALWNSGAIFNRKGNEGGFSWNSHEYLLIVQLHETLRSNDKISAQLAMHILSEKPFRAYDTLLNFIIFDNLVETFSMDETPSISLLFALSENLGIKDDITDLAVLAFLHEKLNIVEEIQILAQLLTEDKINAEEIVSIEALFDILDDFGLYDLKAGIFALINSHDEFGMTDHEPRQAISDFMIGAIDDDDRAFDWLIPFNLRVDWKGTKIQVMPEAEITSIEMPGVDGSIVEDTVYKDRLFSIVAFSEDGMTLHEKEDLKARITQVLDSTKHQTKKLTVQSRGTMFEVKYEGQASIESGPSYVKATVPLRTQPYGMSMFPYELYGSGLVSNIDGDTFLRPKHTITGPIANPSFKLGEITYVWNDTVPKDTYLVINHDKFTCYLIDNFGRKTNALAKLTGEFQKIDAGKSMALVADSNTESRILTEWNTPVLW